MNKRVFRTKCIGLALLVLGLGSCSPDKTENATPTIEVKLAVPMVQGDGTRAPIPLSQLSTYETLDSSDRIQFTGFLIRSSNDPIQLTTRSRCRQQEEELSYEITRPLPSLIQISELLPREYFFSKNLPYPKNLKCIFEFEAVQPSSQAQHRFNFSSQVALTPQSSPAMALTNGMALVSDTASLQTLSDRQFAETTIFSDRADSFQLHCEGFAAKLHLENKHPRIGLKTWQKPDLVSDFPLHEMPYQLCRILGDKNDLLTAWSPYFYIKARLDPPLVSWEMPSHSLAYRGHQPFPKIVVAQLNLHNTQPYPQVVKVYKGQAVQLTPICVEVHRSNPIQKPIATELQAHSGIDLLSEGNAQSTYQILPGGQMSIEYTLTGQLRCRCPLQYPPRIPGIRFRFPKPFMSHEAGFFYQLLPPVTPLVELMTAHSPESTMDGRIFEPLPVGNQLGPLRWAVNHSPRGGPTYPKSPSDLISAQERVGICQ